MHIANCKPLDAWQQAAAVAPRRAASRRNWSCVVEGSAVVTGSAALVWTWVAPRRLEAKSSGTADKPADGTRAGRPRGGRLASCGHGVRACIFSLPQTGNNHQAPTSERSENRGGDGTESVFHCTHVCSPVVRALRTDMHALASASHRSPPALKVRTWRNALTADTRASSQRRTSCPPFNALQRAT